MQRSTRPFVVSIIREDTCLRIDSIWPIWVAEGRGQYDELKCLQRSTVAKPALVTHRQKTRKGIVAGIAYTAALISSINVKVGVLELHEAKYLHRNSP
jgi:hypothetical protein